MSLLVLYRQQRADGAIRAGVELDGHPVLESFEPSGDDDANPALLWYVDIEIDGVEATDEPARLILLLAQWAGEIRSGLHSVARLQELGSDPDLLPQRHESRLPGAGVPMRISYQAVDRVSGRAIASILRSTGDELEKIVSAMSPVNVTAT